MPRPTVRIPSPTTSALRNARGTPPVGHHDVRQVATITWGITSSALPESNLLSDGDNLDVVRQRSKDVTIDDLFPLRGMTQ
jgi:hypothetical protein